MVQAPVAPQIKSFEEYLKYDDGTDTLYEVVDGVLVSMADPIGRHEDFSDCLYNLLNQHFVEANLNYAIKRCISVKIDAPLVRGRKPDLVVMPKRQWDTCRDIEAAAYEAPTLTIEIVSTNWKTDWIDKVADYERTGIPEYWIFDYRALANLKHLKVKQPTFAVCQRVNGKYQMSKFQGDTPIVSPLFPQLQMSVNQLLEGVALFHSQGDRFATYLDFAKQLNQEKQRTEQERQLRTQAESKLEQIAASLSNLSPEQLKAFGIDPNLLR